MNIFDSRPWYEALGRFLVPDRPTSRRYPIALALSYAAIIIVWVLQPLALNYSIYIVLLFTSAAMAYGGLGPALISTVTSVLIVDYFFSGSEGGLGQHFITRISVLTFLLFLALRIRKSWEQTESTINSMNHLVAVAAHELKTPIATMKMVLETIKRKGEGEGMKRIDILERQTATLAGLISSLFDFSHINVWKLELQAVDIDMKSFITEVMARNSYSFKLSACDIALVLEDGVIGLWDKVRLEQILINLVSNACKYGKGKPVTIKSWGDSKNAFISVSDEGIGISPANHSRIFNRFERAVSEKEYVGLGIGLWIVTKIVKAKKGDISVNSEPGKGSTFTVRLPRNVHLHKSKALDTELLQERSG